MHSFLLFLVFALDAAAIAVRDVSTSNSTISTPWTNSTTTSGQITDTGSTLTQAQTSNAAKDVTASEAISSGTLYSGSSVVETTSSTAASSPWQSGSSTNAGDYIAQGIGLSAGIDSTMSATRQPTTASNTTSPSSSSSSSVSAAAMAVVTSGSFASFAASNDTSMVLSDTVYKLQAAMATGASATISEYSNSTTVLSSTNPSANATLSSTLTTGNASTTPFANQSAAVDACWNQWSTYWDIVGTDSVDVPATTITNLYTYYDEFKGSTTELVTSTIINGPFTQTILTTLVTTIITISVPTRTTSYDYTRPAQLALTTPPPCVLPSTVIDQCQSSWNAWAIKQYSLLYFTGTEPQGCPIYGYTTADSCVGPIASYKSSYSSFHKEADTAPYCPQASLPSDMCSGLRSSWLQSNLMWNSQIGGVNGGDISTTVVDGTNSRYTNWPTTSPLAPGCTVGCMTETCQIQAGTVQLLYWPPESATQRMVQNNTFLSANTTSPVTVVALGHTFTSPTAYISFDSLYARDSCTPFGSTYRDQIIAITNTADLKSLWGSRYYATLMMTASFNFTDLYVTPVPESIYVSQPRCQNARKTALDPRQGNSYDPYAYLTWTCPRVAPYEPIISIPDEVRALDPTWASCVGGLNGAYDPPLPLSPVSTVIGVTTPGGGLDTTTPAAPASTPNSPAAPVTTSAETTTPENLPSASTKSPLSQSTAKTTAVGSESGQPPNSQPSKPASEDPSSSDPGSGEPGNTDPGNGDPESSDPNSGNGQPDTVSPSGVQPSASDPPQNTKAPVPVDPPATTNALSVLQSALSSAQQAASSQPAAPVSDPGDSGSVPAPPVVIAVPNGGSATVSQVGGSSVAIGSGGSTTTIVNGGAATVGGQTFSVPATGGAIVVGSSTQALPAAPTQTPTTIVAGGQTLTASSAGSSVVVAQAGSTVTVAPGQAATLGSQTISLAAGNGGLVVGSSTFAAVGVSSPANVGSIPASAVVTAIGQTFTAVAQGGSVVVNNGGSAVTVAAGSTATIAGQVISVPLSGGGVVVAGSSVQLSATQAAPSQAVFTAGGQTITAIAQGGSVVLESNRKATTVPAGGVATIAGQVVSVPSSGGAVIVAGSTLSLSVAPTKVFTAGGQVVTAINQGNGVVLQAAGQSITLAPGAIGVIAGQAVILDPSGDEVVVDGTTVHLDSTTAGAGTAVFTQDGRTITGIRQGNSVVLQEGGRATTVPAEATVGFAGETITNPGARITGVAALTTIMDDGQTLSALDAGGSIILTEGGTTITLAKGQQTFFHGETISALPTGAAIVVNGTQSLSLGSPASGSAFATIVHDGQTLSAFDARDSVVIVENGTTITLAKGQQTVFNGDTISALPTGGAVVIDGTETLSLPSATPTAADGGPGGDVRGAQGEATGSGAWRVTAGWYGIVACIAIGVAVL